MTKRSLRERDGADFQGVADALQSWLERCSEMANTADTADVQRALQRHEQLQAYWDQATTPNGKGAADLVELLLVDDAVFPARFEDVVATVMALSAHHENLANMLGRWGPMRVRQRWQGGTPRGSVQDAYDTALAAALKPLSWSAASGTPMTRLETTITLKGPSPTGHPESVAFDAEAKAALVLLQGNTTVLKWGTRYHAAGRDPDATAQRCVQGMAHQVMQALLTRLLSATFPHRSS